MTNINNDKTYSSKWEDYKFSRNKIVGEVVIKKDISENEIESVIVGAFEGGSNYWMDLAEDKIWDKKPKGIPYSTWATQMLLDGNKIALKDNELENGEILFLTLEKLINGIQFNANKRQFDSDIEDGDAITADCILQYALFGELVYG